MEHISAEFRSTPMLEAAASVVKTLCEAGFESGLVGGCVRDLLLVDRVARLVNGGEDGGRRVIFIIVRGDAHVVIVQVGGEGVLRLPNYAAGEIKADISGQPAGKFALLVLRAGVLFRRYDPLFHTAAQKRHDAFPHLGEEGIKLCHAEAFLVIVEHHVIGSLSLLGAQGGKAAGCRDDLVKHRQEGSEIVLLLGFLPFGGAACQQLLISAVFLLRKLFQAVQLTAQTAQDCALLCAEGFPVNGSGQLPHALPGHQGKVFLREHAHHAGGQLVALRRGQRFRVPAEQGQRRLIRRGFIQISL